MNDFLRTILDSLAYLWPLKMCDQWERAVIYRFGKAKKEVGPGVYVIVPWFMALRCVSVVPAIVGTGRQDITLRDGTVVTFSATATVRVLDAWKALNEIDNFTETTQELIAAVLADRIAQVDASRLAPDNRKRLLSDLTRWVAEEAALFGVEVTKVRFNNFVSKIKTIRLVMDREMALPW